MKQRMILLHGLFGGLSNWTEVIRHFEKRFDIRVPELPLFEKHTSETLNFLIDFLETTITSAGLKNVILVGNSLGGHLAIRYAHRHPNKVKSLILTGSSGLYENTQVGSFLKRGNYDYIRDKVAATFYDPAIATDQLVEEVLQVTTNPAKCMSIIKVAKSTQRDSVLDCLSEIQTPVLLIWGNNDTITPPSVADQFHGNLPNSRIVWLPDCGHAPMMERPEAFNRALESFLD